MTYLKSDSLTSSLAVLFIVVTLPAEIDMIVAIIIMSCWSGTRQLFCSSSSHLSPPHISILRWISISDERIPSPKWMELMGTITYHSTRLLLCPEHKLALKQLFFSPYPLQTRRRDRLFSLIANAVQNTNLTIRNFSESLLFAIVN